MTKRTPHRTIRLLASTGILGLALAIAPVGLDLSLDAFKIDPVQALAKSGSGSDGDGGSDSSGSGSDGDDDHDNSGSDSDDDDDHDNSGSGSHGDDGSDVDNSGPGSVNSGHGRGRGRGRGRGGHAASGGEENQDSIRPEIALDLSAADLNDVMAGRKILVDDLGRVLEVEIELEHGIRTVTAKPHGGDSRRNPGPITSFELVDAGGATPTPGTPGNDDGTPDQGPGDN